MVSAAGDDSDKKNFTRWRSPSMVLEAARDPILAFSRWQKTHGDITVVDLGWTRVHVLQHPDLARAVLVEQADGFDKWALRHIVSQVLGRGLLTSLGKEHKTQRRELASSFGGKDYARFLTTITRHAERLATEWPDDGPVDLGEDMGRLTIAVIAEVLFDVDVWEEARELRSAIDTLSRRIMDVVVRHRVGAFAYKTSRFDSIIDSERVLAAFVSRVKQKHAERAPNQPNVLTHILKNEANHAPNYARDQIVTLLVTGHETMAHALTWALLALTAHDEVQARMHEELDSVLADRTPTEVDLPKLTTPLHLFLESLRTSPPGWVFSRRVVRPTQLGSHALRAGDYVVMSPYLLHRDERFWNDPLHFRPERFAGQNPEPNHAFAFLPFSVGPRACIAANMAKFEGTLLLATLCQRFAFQAHGETQREELPRYTMKMNSEVYVRVARRRRSASR